VIHASILHLLLSVFFFRVGARHAVPAPCGIAFCVVFMPVTLGRRFLPDEGSLFGSGFPVGSCPPESVTSLIGVYRILEIFSALVFSDLR
jgi:hypothetical protein